MANLFGGKNPFDLPIFTQIFGCLSCGKNPFDGPLFIVSSGVRSGSTTGTPSFSVKTIKYVGFRGVYYISSVGRRNGKDGVFLMEEKEEDRRVGQLLHTLSKGIHDKGHSVKTKHFSDGKVESVLSLHNLQKDELAGFEDIWEKKADKVLPGWRDGFEPLKNIGVNKKKQMCTGSSF